MTGRVPFEILHSPITKLGMQSLLLALDALLALNGAVAAAEHDLCLVIERAQQFAFPAVPDARTNGLDVADGQHQQKLQAFHALHDGSEILDRLGVGEIARLGNVRHCQMLLDEPGDRFGLRFVETKPGA
jgi:hypothetical protein